jgi:hypothetical protein
MGRHLPHRPRPHGGEVALPLEVQHVEWSDTDGTVRLNWGRWTLHATAGTLVVRAEAEDEESLRRIQDLLAKRLETIGRREHLAVTWQRPDADQLHSTREPRKPRLAPWILIAAGALLVAVHLGIGGALLTAPQFTVAAVGLLAVLVVKFVGLRLLVAHRRRQK